MTEPKRLADSDNEMERALLRAGRARAPRRARERAVAAATATLVGSTALTGSSAAAGGGAIAKTIGAGGLKWLVVASVVGIGTITGIAVHESSHDAAPQVIAPPPAPALPPAPPSPTPAATNEATPIETAVPAPAPLAMPAPAPSTTIAQRRAAPSAEVRNEPSLRGEVDLLDRARTAINEGNAPSALAQLDSYDAKFPHGFMTTEAAVLRVEALVAAGDRAGAERAAATFLQRNPQSPYASRVRSLVGAP